MNCIEEYELVDDLTSIDDIRITPLWENFWVGVFKNIKPSPPVPRNKTICFTSRPVYMFNGHRVFSIEREGDKIEFYYVPYEEMVFIQKVGFSGGLTNIGKGSL